MQRITKLDAQDLFPAVSPIVVTLATSAVFVGLAAGLRAGVDAVWPYAGPFSVNIPAVLLATLVGRIQSGMIVLVLSVLMTWYFVLPHHDSFVFENPGDGPRTAVNLLMGVLVVLITEVARRAVRIAIAEREERIRERDFLLREVDHRVKNNLTILASLLSAQQRKTDLPQVQEALEDARGRIFSLAQAYDFLNLRHTRDNDIEMKSFLESLIDAMHRASGFGDNVRVEVEADEWRLDRTHAGAVGLLVNEIITNAVKHAFAGRERGTIRVSLRAQGNEAIMTIEDDGVGFEADASGDGKGRSFLNALARTARADLSCTSTPNGTCYTATLSATEV